MNAGVRWKELAVQHVRGLPGGRSTGGGCYICPRLGCGLSDHYATGWPGRSLRCCGGRNDYSLLGCSFLPFSLPCYRRRRRGSSAPLGLLLLCCLSGPGDEPVDGHCPSSHHLPNLNWLRLGNYLFNVLLRSPLNNLAFWLNGRLRFDLLVCTFSACPGHTLGRLVTYRLAFVGADVTWAELAGLSYRKFCRKKTRMPNVDVGQEGAIYQ